MSSPAPTQESSAPANVNEIDGSGGGIGAQRAQPVAQEPCGLIPKRPSEGWTYAKVPGSMWTSFELDYMNLNLPLYRERKGKDRDNLVQWVKKQIHVKWGVRYNAVACINPKVNKEWRKRKKSIGDWFRNHGRNQSEIQIPHWTGKATFQQVLVVKKRSEILALTDKLAAGAQRSDAEGKWIKHYQPAVRQIRQGLSEEEAEDIRREMEAWDSSTVPELQQAKQAAERGNKTICSLHKMAFKTMGMRCVTLTMHYDIAGMPVYGIVDHNDTFVKKDGGQVKTLKSWRLAMYSQINSAWAEYISNVIVPAEKPELLEDDVRQRLPPPKPPIHIERLQGGHHLIPDVHKAENQADKTLILCQFLNAEYKLASGGGTRSVPWIRFEKNIHEFIAAKYIPDGVMLKDPEKMSGPDRHRVLAHWRQRQDLGKIALKFHGVFEKDRMIQPRYSVGMARPKVASERPAPVRLPEHDHVPDDLLGEDEVDDDDTEDSTEESSDAAILPLPTPAPTSPAPGSVIQVPQDGENTSDKVPAPRKQGRPRGTLGRRAKQRGKAKGAVRDVGVSPDPIDSMLTPEGTPAPAPKKGPRPKPKPKTTNKVVLKRDLQSLGVVLEGDELENEAEGERRRSPRKAAS